jgi:hypothetical protein
MVSEIHPDVLPAKPEPPAEKGAPAIADPGPLGLGPHRPAALPLEEVMARGQGSCH